MLLQDSGTEGETMPDGKGTVLVVDDDEMIIAVLRDALEDEGYEVLSAVNGGALPIARQRQPQVILLDIMMPGMDGVEVSKRLRADPVTERIPIVAMSASTMLAQVADQMPIDDRLSKPFEIDRLYDVVARWTQAP
ncbi:MAG TPA: response regulator [Chloroflexota bacterium]|nr:response regulator [Chloroflexota bacterium]